MGEKANHHGAGQIKPNVAAEITGGYAPGYWGQWDSLWDNYPVAAVAGLTWWGVNSLGDQFGYSDYYNPYYTESMPAYYSEPIITVPVEPVQTVITQPAQAAPTQAAQVQEAPAAAPFRKLRRFTDGFFAMTSSPIKRDSGEY